MDIKKQTIALIDIGSNSIRLVIFQINSSGHYKEIQNLKVVARLSSHINRLGNITDEGIEVLVTSLKYFRDVISTYEVSTLHCVATAAIRQAKNQQEILELVKRETNFNIKVLSDYEEAFYGFLAVTNSTNIQNGITIDIGGGSTEVTLFKDRQILNYHSFPFGAISLKESFINNEIPSDDELERLQTFLKEKFNSLPWLKGQMLPIIGIGGSARNLTLIHQKGLDYPLSGLHQYELYHQDIVKINNKIKALPLKQRQKVDGLSKDRADIIIPAIEAISMLMEQADSSKFVMSNKGLRDGLFYHELLQQLNLEQFPSVTTQSLDQVMQEYSIDKTNVNYIVTLVTQLFNEIERNYPDVLTEEELNLLQYSTKVLNIGDFIGTESSSKHTFYILTNKPIDGLTHKQRLSIACIASFKSRSSLQSYIQPFKHLLTETQIETFELLGSILKFCYTLNFTKRKLVKTIKINKNSTGIQLTISSLKDPYFERVQANKNKKHLERSLKSNITLKFINEG